MSTEFFQGMAIVSVMVAGVFMLKYANLFTDFWKLVKQRDDMADVMQAKIDRLQGKLDRLQEVLDEDEEAEGD